MPLGAWMEERAGTASLARRIRDGLRRRVSPSAGWSAAMGAGLIVLILTQAASGSLLAAYYKPTWDGAHASVESVLTRVPMGWLIRGAHLWGAHLILALLTIHLIRAFWQGRYRAPREVVWMTGVFLLAIIAGGAITGQMLPLDEEGYNGALVASDFAGPVGNLVRGGNTVGENMLGRFFAAHALWLPAIGVMICAAHLALVAKHGLERGGDGPTLLESSGYGALVTLGALATLSVLAPLGLGPAASATDTPEGVRPLWFFLPAYQLLKYVPSPVVAFGSLGLFLMALAVPFLDRGERSRRWLRRISVVVLAVIVIFGTAGALAHRDAAGFRFDTHGLPHRAP